MATETENLPTLNERRDMLKNAIGQYRRSGFSTDMERIALEAQTPIDRNEQTEKEKKLKQLRNMRDNQYAAAARLQVELDALPEDEKPEETGDSDAETGSE